MNQFTIESEDFYNICQMYRHAKDNHDTCEAYQTLIDYIDVRLSKLGCISVNDDLLKALQFYVDMDVQCQELHETGVGGDAEKYARKVIAEVTK